MSKVSIYGLKDPHTGEVFYVGQSINPKKRYSQHLNQYGIKNAYIAVRVYQLLPDKPALIILDEVDSDQADSRERELIAHYLECGQATANKNLTGKKSYARRGIGARYH